LLSPLELAVEERVRERRRRRDRYRLVTACVLAAVAGGLAPVGAMFAWRQVSTWSAPAEPEQHVAASIASEPQAAPRLPEEDRRAIYRALIEAEDRALADAVGAGLREREPTRRVRTETLKHQHRRFVELAAQYRADTASTVARRYGIGPDQIREIEMEGARGNWFADVEAPPLVDTAIAGPATPSAEPSWSRAVAEARRPPVPPASTVRPIRESAPPANEAPITLPPRPSPFVRPSPGQSASSETGADQ
jgi:hypothetical protein